MAKKHSSDSPSTRQTPEAISALAERPTKHADAVRNPASRRMGDDMRQASKVIAEWGILEITKVTSDAEIRARLTAPDMPAYTITDRTGVAPHW
jgi:hypothetical protein